MHTFQQKSEASIENLKIFDDEIQNIRLAFNTAKENSNLQSSIIFSDSLFELLSLRFYPKEIIEWQKTTLKICDLQNEKLAQCIILGNLGTIYTDFLGDKMNRQ